MIWQLMKMFVSLCSKIIEGSKETPSKVERGDMIWQQIEYVCLVFAIEPL